MFVASDAQRRRAALYALVHRGSPGDIDLYVRACRGARSILEIGCGSGRVLKALAALDVPLCGLDCDAGMLAEAHAALPPAHRDRVELLAGDMRTIALGRTFDRVLIPYNALFALPTDRDIVAALACARAHLGPSAELWFDVYRDDEPGLPPPPAEQLPSDYEHLLSVVADGRFIDVWERERPLPLPRSFVMEYRYDIHPEVRDGDAAPESVELPIAHHYVGEALLRELVAQAGLRIVEMWGDFRGGESAPHAEHMVVRARAAD